MPVGEVSTGCLRTTLKNMSGKRSTGQTIKCIDLPSESVDTRPECHRAVHTASGDHDVGTKVKRLGNWKRSQIGIDTCNALGRRKRLPGKHLGQTSICKLRFVPGQVITGHHGDLEVEPGLGYGITCGNGTSPRVQASRIRDEFHTLAGDLSKIRAKRGLDEVRRIAEIPIPVTSPGHDRHGDLGQVIID